jgi:hypothetical protein
MATRKVTTATLIRGKVYTYRHPDHTPQNPKDHLRFKFGVPVVIDSPKIVQLLEDLVDEVPDGDGELLEKPIFRINRNVDAPDDDAPRATRVDPDRKIKMIASGKPTRLRR